MIFYLFIHFNEHLLGIMFLVYKFQLIQDYNLILSSYFQICEFMADGWLFVLNEL